MAVMTPGRKPEISAIELSLSQSLDKIEVFGSSLWGFSVFLINLRRILKAEFCTEIIISLPKE